MRTVGEIPHPRLKITIFHHNAKYTAQFELDQVNLRCSSRESESLSTAEEFKSLISDDIIVSVEKKLQSLNKFWGEAHQANDEELNFDVII